MPYRFDLHVRLEAIHTAHDLQALRDAMRARVHDPVWFLGRQWQLGEHRGRDAASPALVHLTVTETPVAGRSAAPEEDPQITPPEAIIESEPEQWWTVGRRIRVGARAAERRPAGAGGTTRRSCGRVGSAVRWAERSRSRRSGPTGREPHSVCRTPCSRPRASRSQSRRTTGSRRSWRTRRRSPRHDDAHDPAARRRRRRLVLRHGHRAGPPPASPPVVRTSYPTRVAYDGSPHPRWWQIEDHRYDPGAVAPHRTQLAAMMLIHVTASHGDDWFTAPLLSPTGTLVAVTACRSRT